MIDINELRQSAQAATPGPWYIGSGTYEGRNIYSVEAVTDDEGFTYNPVVATAEDDDVVCWAANARLIAAANPAVISELLDRLEAAEADALEQARLNGMGSEREAALMAKLEAAEKERDALRAALRHEADCVEAAKAEIEALRAKIEATEQQEPARLVTATAYRWRYRGAVMWQYGELTEETVRRAKEHNHEVQPLYALPGAQNAPVEQDEFVRKAWARFSNELHRSPGAPYPGMSEAFEQHFSQSFTDRDWRAESGTWAAAWKAAKRHGAQPALSVPDGWKLVPIWPTQEMINHVIDERLDALAAGKDHTFIDIYKAMLAAAPEAKP